MRTKKQIQELRKLAEERCELYRQMSINASKMNKVLYKHEYIGLGIHEQNHWKGVVLGFTLALGEEYNL